MSIQIVSSELVLLIRIIYRKSKISTKNNIPVKGNEFIREIKKRSDIRLFEVTHDNRDSLIGEIVDETL